MEAKIKGVRIKKLKWHKDERGRLAEILRSDDDLFTEFGQVYVTTVNPGFAKAWHLHKRKTENIMCVKGKVKLVIYDARENSESFGQVQEFFLNFEEPVLVQVPPKVYTGIESMTQDEGAVIIIPDQVYNYENPDEHRLPFNTEKIPYKWKAKEGG